MSTDRDIQHEIDRARVNALFSSGVTGLVGVLIAAGLYVSFSWYEMDQRVLYNWIGCISFMVVLRGLLTLRFRNRAEKRELDPGDVIVWENTFYATLLITGAVWSSTLFFPYETNILGNVIFVALVLISLSASAIALYSHSFLAMSAYLSLAILPLATRLFMIGERQAFIVGFVSLVYYAIMIRQIRITNRTLLDNLRLSILNRNISLRDPLTGLANRRRLDVFLEKLIPMTVRAQHGFSVILIDIDNFKAYNDSQGHHGGDIAICAVSDIILEETRSADLAVRFGGDEFLIVLPDTEGQEATAIAARIHDEVIASTYVTISAGVAIHHVSENFEETLRHADTALYRAKHSGRDRVEASEAFV